MYSIKDVSTQIGLSHSEMANLPGIIRSMLAKAETRDRRLNIITLLKLAAFENSVREAYSDDTNADLSISYCKNRLRDNSLALRNLEVKQEKMQRCCVIGKDLPIAVLGCEHQKRVERRHMNCGSGVRQIGEIKIRLCYGENRLLEYFIKALFQPPTSKLS